jgi:hypothetical protein
VKTHENEGHRRLFVGAALLALALTGCGSADEPLSVTKDDKAAVAEPSLSEYYVHRRHDAATGGTSQGTTAGTGGVGNASGGGTAGTSGSALTYDCNLCTQANDCCEAVNPEGSGCTFSANTCFAYSADSQKNYSIYCLTFIRTVISAWQPQSPPPVCQLQI